jgi:two-component system response regulator DesR
MKVYIADDSPVMLGRLKQTLSPIPGAAATQTFPDGKALLAAIQADPPALVVTDVMMPHMTGIEVAKAVRDLNLPVKVLLCTSVGQQAALGDFSCLIKPFTASQMRQALYTLFGTLDFGAL